MSDNEANNEEMPAKEDVLQNKTENSQSEDANDSEQELLLCKEERQD